MYILAVISNANNYFLTAKYGQTSYDFKAGMNKRKRKYQNDYCTTGEFILYVVKESDSRISEKKKN